MTEQKEFKSDTVTFTLERKPGCKVEYKVKASPELVKKARQEAVKSVSKEVSLPGFRKGHAPSHLVLKKFEGPVNEQWDKAIADKVFRECQKLAHTPLLGIDAQINFKIQERSLEEGAQMTYTFESEPLVPDISLDGLELEEVKREIIDDKVIEENIKDIQSYFVTWEKVEGRGVQENDHVVIDVDIIEETPHRKAFTHARFEVKKERMSQWMYTLLLGMNPGEAKEGISKPDEDATDEDKESMSPKKVRLTLQSIETAIYPPLDDPLAQKMGAKNAEELRENLEKLLNKRANDHVQKEYREQMSTYLLEKYPFELPQTLLQKETQFRTKQLVQDPSFQQKLMNMSGEERKEAIKDIEMQGEKAVRLFYISRKIIQDNNIHISPSEVEKNINTPLDALFSDYSDFYNARERSQEQRAIATSRLILTKAEDFLISKAKVVPPKPKKNPATPKKTEEEEKTTSAKESGPYKENTEEDLT